MPEGTENQGAAGAGSEKSAGSAPAGDPPKNDPPKTLTQEQVDAIVADRIQRERQKFADYEGLKEKAKAFDAAEAAKQTELERAQAAAKKAADDSQATIARANATLKRASILAEAAGQKAADPEVVVALLVNEEGITVDDAGNVTGVKEAVKKLLKDKPFLAAASSGKSGGEFGGTNEPGIDERIAEAEKKGDWATASALKLQKAGAFPQA